MTRTKAIVLVLVLLAIGGLSLRLFRESASPTEHLQNGRKALAAGDSALAKQSLDKLERLGATDQALVLRGEMRLKGGNPSGAISLLNQVKDQGEIRREAIAITGQCFLEMRKLRDAERAFAFVLSESPTHVDAHRGLAAVYFDQGALLKALQHLEEVARLDSTDGRPYRMMGYIHSDLDRRAEAVTSYREALRRGLNGRAEAEVREELAEQLVGLGRHQEALEVLGTSKTEKESERAIRLRGEAEWAAGNTSAAVARIDQGLTNYPDSPALLRVRGRLHSESAEWGAAAVSFERAIAQDPSDLTALHQLATVYDRLGKTGDANRIRLKHQQIKEDLLLLTSLNREADARPWDMEVREKLAAVCDRIGKQDLAEMWRRSAAACKLDRELNR